MRHAKMADRAVRILLLAAALVTVLLVGAIFLFLILRSLPTLRAVGPLRFLLGDRWSPDRYDTFDTSRLAGDYGILPMLAGSLAATVGALAVGGTLGYFSAVFLVFFCPRNIKPILSMLIRLLAGIPSVVYGFFGIYFLLPLLARAAPTNGSGLLAASLILGIMILPTVVTLSRTALEAVPATYYQGAASLGADHAACVFRTVAPAASSGIRSALLLGMGRALGETMAVVMVAGNAPTFPRGLFRSFRTLTANIVMEMSYAGEVQEGALIATGTVLLLLLLLLNLLFHLLWKEKKASASPRQGWIHSCSVALQALRDNRVGLRIRSLLCRIAGAFCAIALALILGFVLSRGLPPLVQHADTLFGKFTFGTDTVSLIPPLLTTLLSSVLSLAIAIPIGVMTALFLHEFARHRGRFVSLVHHAIVVLSGVPSIVFGLFGIAAILPLLGGRVSILAGALTAAILLLPTVAAATEESLRAVGDGLREGGLALGATKTRTVLRLVLPAARMGILSATVLSIGRVIGESAPFLYTMGSTISPPPSGFLDSGASLSVALYQLSGEGWHTDAAFAAAAMLILLVLVLQLAAERLIRKKSSPPKRSK